MQKVRIVVHLMDTESADPKWRKAHEVIIDEDYSPQMLNDTLGALSDRVEGALGRIDMRRGR